MLERFALAAALVSLAVTVPVAVTVPAAAQTVCAAKTVRASGSSAILEGAARGQARSAWIRKVSQSARLGPSYAVWLRARDHRYTCKRNARAFVCEASAVPCKI